jgi:hypothetical protein
MDSTMAMAATVDVDNRQKHTETQEPAESAKGPESAKGTREKAAPAVAPAAAAAAAAAVANAAAISSLISRPTDSSAMILASNATVNQAMKFIEGLNAGDKDEEPVEREEAAVPSPTITNTTATAPTALAASTSDVTNNWIPVKNNKRMRNSTAWNKLERNQGVVALRSEPLIECPSPEGVPSPAPLPTQKIVAATATKNLNA